VVSFAGVDRGVLDLEFSYLRCAFSLRSSCAFSCASAIAFSLRFSFLGRYRSSSVDCFALSATDVEGEGFGAGLGASRLGLSGLGLAGLYLLWKWSAAVGRFPLTGEGVEGAGEGVDGSSDIDLRFLFFSAFFEDCSFDNGCFGNDMLASIGVGDEAEPTCGGKLDGLGGFGSFDFGFDFGFELDVWPLAVGATGL
jgi:hypothetical protein